MNIPIKVKKGIYIDMECTAVIPISNGVFIPASKHLNDNDQRFQEDLTAFLDRWFTLSEGEKHG